MVARETSIQEGLAALGLDATRAPVLAAFADLLEGEAGPAGFLGPAEGERLVERHILDSASLAPLLSPGRLLDVGSGAGLPGLVLAVLRPDHPTVLVESHLKRASFLERAATLLGLHTVTVVRARAEEAARTDLRDASDAGTARALAPPPVALELVLPFVRTGGVAVLAVGASADPDAVRAAARELGGGHVRMVAREVPGLEEQGWAMIVSKEEPTPERYPRRTGIPAKRPLGT